MKNKKYHKVGTCTQNNRNIVERSVIDTLTHKYITVQFPGVSHAIRYKKKGDFVFFICVGSQTAGKPILYYQTAENRTLNMQTYCQTQHV